MLAAVITVTSLEDNLALDGQVTLREAIAAANTNQSVDGSTAGNGADVINFSPALGGGTIDLTLGELAITEALTIGAGELQITIDGGSQSRLINFNAGEDDLSLQGLTLTGGQALGDGGAVLFNSDGLLTIAGSVITGNTTSADGGGIALLDGTLMLVDTEVSNNQALEGGGIELSFAEFASVVDSSIDGNTAAANGGGIRTFDTELEIINSTLSNNSATGLISDGGAIGAIGNATVSISGSQLTGNSANENGGAIDTNGLLTIADSQLSNNTASGSGGAIFTFDQLLISDSVLSGNTAAEEGGAIDTFSNIILTRSIVANNVAAGDQLGIGGGINLLGGRLEVVDSTISGNSSGGSGGGIAGFASSIEIHNSTISGNSTSGVGGGIDFGSGTVVLEHSTVTLNSAGATGGGIASDNTFNSANQQLTIFSSIVAGNTDNGTAPDFNALPDNIDGEMANFVEFSLIGTALGTGLTPSPLIGGTLQTDGLGNIVGSPLGALDPLLGPLQDNGGDTLTHELLPGSPAIDAGNGSFDTLLSPFDQRGLSRRGLDGDGDGLAAIDIGAVEQQVGTPLANQQPLLGAIVVTSLDDNTTVDGQVTLREAIEAANTDASVDGSVAGFGEDVIVFAPELSGGTISLSGAELAISEAVSIVHLGGDEVTIDAGGLSRVIDFDTDQGNLGLLGLTITGGVSSSDGAGVFFDSDGLLTISGSTVTGNTALGAADGGGIAAPDGVVRLLGAVFSDNNASLGGAIDVGLNVVLSISDSQIVGNSATGSGGGIASSADFARIENSILSNNSASSEGGAIDSSGILEIVDSDLSNNVSSNRAGAIRQSVESLRITGGSLSNNQAGGSGGAISTSGALFITAAELSGNTADDAGGAISISASLSNITLDRVSLFNNMALDGIFADGGAIETLGGQIRVTNSTLSGNSAGGDGGAIETFAGSIHLTNTTVLGNSAGDDGGGLSAEEIFITSSTIVGNVAAGEGGGIFAEDFLSISSSVIAGNVDDGSGPAFVEAIDPSGADGTFLGFSFIDSLFGTSIDLPTFNAAGNLLGFSPGLSPLQDNGGPTLTLVPLPGSPLVDAGIPFVIESLLPNDQRGFLRTFDDGDDGTLITDIGATELQPEFVLPPDPDEPPPPPPVDNGNTQPVLTVSANRLLAVEDSGLQTAPDFAMFDPGAGESDQVAIAFPITNVTNPGLFVQPPAVDLDGNLVFVLADDAAGESTFNVAVQDNGGGFDTSLSELITLTVSPVNDAPTLEIVDESLIPPLVPSGAAVPIDLIVGDIEDGPFPLIVTATSSDPDLFPAENLIASGTGINRRLQVLPVPGQSGTASITVSVTDSEGAQADLTFDLSVSPPAIVDEPTINVSPAGAGGLADPPDLPQGPQPTSFAQQRSEIGRLVFDLALPITQATAAEIVLTNLGVNADADPDVQVPLTDSQISVSPDGLQLLIDFAPGQFADGVYQIELLPSLTGDEPAIFNIDDFFVLAGDWNGDGIVNIEDFNTFVYWFSNPVGTAPSYVDLDNNGFINISDFSIFADNFGAEITLPGESVSTLSTSLDELNLSLTTLLNPTDVNGDGTVSPLDALNVINELTTGSSEVIGFSVFDVNRDGQVTPLDALNVINDLTAAAPPAALLERSATVMAENVSADDPTEETLVALAIDALSAGGGDTVSVDGSSPAIAADEFFTGEDTGDIDRSTGGLESTLQLLTLGSL